jgi:energy-coupling factor transport system ATP-binding protein
MIVCENVCHTYQAGSPFEKVALKDINLHITAGELVAIIGHTGSGKSTLIQHFNALLKPTSGRVLIDGVDTSTPKQDLRAVRKKVGLVFQYPEHQLMEETVRKDIAFGPRNLGLPENEIEDRVLVAAKSIGLKDELLDKSPFELSGGEKRRVAIAGVLAMEPDVLVLDEPTAGLDPAGRDELLDLVLQLNDCGMTIVLVSHSMEDVARTARRIIVINDTRIAYDGSVAEVFSHVRELTDMGLSVPQVSLVIDRLRARGVDLPGDIYTVEQARDALLGLLRK